MIETVKAAIRSRTLLSLHYDPGTRLVEPHCIGYGSDGQILLRAFQISGPSESGEHVDWKLFRLDRCRDIRDAGATFAGPRPQYNAKDKVMTRGVLAAL